ncbi:MAG: hypothetical protein WEB60_06770 [Terrimicrobiaceae bacterium]
MQFLLFSGRIIFAWMILAMVNACSRPPAEAPVVAEEPVTEATPPSSGETFAKEFAEPPNEYRLVQYQLNDQTLKKYP